MAKVTSREQCCIQGMKIPFNVGFRRIFYPFALGCLFLLGSFGNCERDREPNPVPAPACRVTRRDDAAGAVASEVYTYNRHNRLVAAHQEQNGNAFSFRTFSYNENHQLTGQTFASNSDASITQTITYRYNAQGQRTGWVVMENGRYTEATRELDAEGNCTTLTWITTDLNSGVSSTTRHVYQYQNGNLVGSITDVGTDAERQSTFDYYPDQENKLRAYEEIVAPFRGDGPSPSRNMIKTATSVATKNSEAATETRQYAYEYNAIGFPTRIHSVHTYVGTTSASNTLFEYDCE